MIPSGMISIDMLTPHCRAARIARAISACVVRAAARGMSGPGLGGGAQRVAPIAAARRATEAIIIYADASILEAAPNKAFSAAVRAFFVSVNAR